VRLPQRFLRWWIALNVVVTAFFAWLWAIARMTGPQRIGTAGFLLLVLVWLWVGALWFVAWRVVIDDRGLTRRVGHRRTRTPLTDVAKTRVEPGKWPGYDTVVLTLRNGSDRAILTRRAGEMVAALGRGTTLPTQGA
jgi:4-amino-4-deoxy-L-arabinose transferase-like glycosyltransferase